MKKQAFLIIAHNDYKLLQLLVEALDNDRCDIFIHIDKKCKHWPELKTSHSKLVIFSEVKVWWGDYSQIECEYSLFKKAASMGPYEYYHLISGVDFPLKPINKILDYFEENRGKEFLFAYKYDPRELEKKVRYYRFIPRYFRKTNYFLRIIRALSLMIQRALHLRRNKKIIFQKGANWCSITDDLVKYLIYKEKYVRKLFHNTFCADEIFIQTLCWYSPFREKTFKSEFCGNGNLRYVDWTTGVVKVFTIEDFDTLMASNCLFARKFSSDNIDVVEKIFNNIKND